MLVGCFCLEDLEKKKMDNSMQPLPLTDKVVFLDGSTTREGKDEDIQEGALARAREEE